MTERFEQRREQGVELEAIPAASLVDEFGDQMIEVQRDIAAESDVEVLVRDRVDVEALEFGERIGPSPSDSVEVPVQGRVGERHRVILTRPMYSALDDLRLDHLFVVHAGRNRFRLHDKVTAVPAASALLDGV